MRRLLVIFGILGFFFSSCSKETSVGQDSGGSSDEYYVTCKINGIATTFNVSPIAGIQRESGFMAFNVLGAATAQTNTNTIAFIIITNNVGGNISTGTYTDHDDDFELLATITQSDNSIDYQAGATVFSEAENAGVPIDKQITVNLTTLTDQVAKGTFSGDFYKDGDPNGDIIKVTEGKFFVKVYQ